MKGGVIVYPEVLKELFKATDEELEGAFFRTLIQFSIENDYAIYILLPADVQISADQVGYDLDFFLKIGKYSSEAEPKIMRIRRSDIATRVMLRDLDCRVITGEISPEVMEIFVRLGCKTVTLFRPPFFCLSEEEVDKRVEESVEERASTVPEASVLDRSKRERQIVKIRAEIRKKIVTEDILHPVVANLCEVTNASGLSDVTTALRK